MKKILMAVIAIIPLLAAAPASASVIDEIQSAIKGGDFKQINIIAAKNPSDQGDIAMYLLEQSQNSALNQATRVKVFNAVAPFGGQVPLSDAGQATGIIGNMLNLVNDPGFSKQHPKEAGAIFSSLLTLSSQPNILTANPNLHDAVVAAAQDFAENNPDGVDQKLKDEVELALQIGLPPPLGPRGIINPSRE